MRKTTLLWWTLFICYMVVVLGVTLMERSGYWGWGKIMPLFYSYKLAWFNGNAVEWRNIILNICMFVPLGFLLPLGLKCFQSFYLTALAGCLFTVVIEASQLYFHLGMFELDDLMNNTVGTMIGFGIYVLYGKLILRKDFHIHKILLAQIPLLFTILSFGSLFLLYQFQELGNLSYEFRVPFDHEKLSVSTDTTFSEEAGTAAVYKCVRLSKEETISFAREFYNRLGLELDESQNDFYDDTAIFYDTKGSFHLWVDYLGGCYWFTDFDTKYGAQSAVKKNASEEEVKAALESYGINIPDDISMYYREDLESYVFEYVNYEADSYFLDGSLVVEYMDNGKIAGINYGVITSKLYKEFPIVSEQEAYEMICAGNFNCQLIDDMKVHIQSCSLEYITDSKGYLQPVYQFKCESNNRPSTIGIPAIQKR